MANYFQKWVLETVQEVDESLSIMMFGFLIFDFVSFIWQKIITAQSEERAQINFAFVPKPVTGSSVEPRCPSAFILVENGSGLRCHSSEAEAI